MSESLPSVEHVECVTSRGVTVSVLGLGSGTGIGTTDCRRVSCKAFDVSDVCKCPALRNLCSGLPRGPPPCRLRLRSSGPGHGRGRAGTEGWGGLPRFCPTPPSRGSGPESNRGPKPEGTIPEVVGLRVMGVSSWTCSRTSTTRPPTTDTGYPSGTWYSTSNWVV